LLTKLEMVVGCPQDILATESVEGSCKLCKCEMDLTAMFSTPSHSGK